MRAAPYPMFDPASPRAVEPLSAARLIEKAQDNTFSDKHIEHAVKINSSGIPCFQFAHGWSGFRPILAAGI